MSRTAESSTASSVRVSTKSKESLIGASHKIGEATGKAPHLSDLMDELVTRYLPQIVEHRVAGPAPTMAPTTAGGEC